MASWIFMIGPKHPEHWGYAVDSGFWDIVSRRNVKAGDDVFFWQSKGSLISWTTATEDEIDIVEDMPPAAWNDKPYVRRIPIEVVSEEPKVDITWTTLANGAGITAKPSNGQILVPEGGEEYLRTLFADGADQSDDTTEPTDYPDTRATITATIKQRRGQQQFRQKLLAAYDNRCAITGSQVVDVLEAAHIRPYRGSHSHRVQNGILLRSDLHTLFDLHLLTIDENLVVRMSPEVADSEYAQYDGTQLRTTTPRRARPAKENLRKHHAHCDWFTGASS
ncbi:MAG: HNH endonuclease signature motif containing protein [Gordonia sp. (in: high G+C Gram-positive bacteria)]|uniref:HNH endonuclease n=1 Tax=Gordonia sp. (in: high G+C Gram-positive bacteria) TaxID=84139 RepID=UPI003C7630C1